MHIIITLIIFGVIVVIHEWGHFITAKKSGVEVPEFAVGMGPKIYSFTKKGTMYSLRLIPVGGFCRMKGEADDEGDGSFSSAPIINRMIIICAGSFMNLVLAIIVFTFLSAFSPIATTQIRDFSDNSPAKSAGLQVGDKIISINDSAILGKSDISFAISDTEGDTADVKVKRNSEEITYHVKIDTTKKNGKIIGIITDVKSPLIGKSQEGFERADIIEVFKDGIYKTYFSVKITLIGLMRLVTAKLPVSEISGPIGLTAVVDDVYKESVQYGIKSVIMDILYIMGLLSANLCVMNMLPLPALDGGRFIFLVFEALRGKPVPPEKEGIVHFVGFAVLMLFGILVAFGDIMKFM